MYKRGPSTGIKCPAITQKGTPCPIDGEDFRNGWCHVHDPNGKSHMSMECTCEWHRAADIARFGL